MTKPSSGGEHTARRQLPSTRRSWIERERERARERKRARKSEREREMDGPESREGERDM